MNEMVAMMSALTKNQTEQKVADATIGMLDKQSKAQSVNTFATFVNTVENSEQLKKALEDDEIRNSYIEMFRSIAKNF